MIWSEVTAVPLAVLPMAALREHLRLGTGFADDGAQDPLLEAILRSAMAAIERRTGKALLSRDFQLRLEGWRDAELQTLPVAPATALVSVGLRDATGTTVPLPTVSFRLIEDIQRPSLSSVSGYLPPIPTGGTAVVVFTAGFGPAWSDVPADLGRAVMMLAAHFHENRHAAGTAAEAMPFGVQALLEPWRTVRLLAGGRG